MTKALNSFYKYKGSYYGSLDRLTFARVSDLIARLPPTDDPEEKERWKRRIKANPVKVVSDMWKEYGFTLRVEDVLQAVDDYTRVEDIDRLMRARDERSVEIGGLER